MPDDPIDFASEKERRIEARKDAAIGVDQAQWEAVRDQLIGILITTTSKSSMVSAGLRAMLDLLEKGAGLSRNDAVAFIAQSLKAFEE